MKRPLIISLTITAVGLLIWLFVSEMNQPRPVDWKVTFSRSDKNPYGCFVTYALLPDLFPDKDILPIQESISSMVFSAEDEDTYVDPYRSYTDEEYAEEIENEDYFSEEYDEVEINDEDIIFEELQSVVIDTAVADANFLFISELVTINNADGKALRTLVNQGSTVFMAAQGFNSQIPQLDSIEVHQRQEGATDSTTLYFTSHRLKSKGQFSFRKGSVNTYFESIPEGARVLVKNNYGDPTMIEVPHGNGSFFLSSTPLAFTNYNMLKPENHEFISASLSYLNVQDTYWCGNYLGFDYFIGDPGNSKSNRPQEDRSILDFIHKHPPLTWAFYLALGTILLFMLVEIKRRQRIIPVVKPLTNTSVEFTNTVSQLYFQRGNHRDIALKRINYFLEFLRSRYHLNTNEINEAFIAKTSLKTGVNQDKATSLFNKILRIRQATAIDQHQLIDLNRDIDSFKKECNS